MKRLAGIVLVAAMCLVLGTPATTQEKPSEFWEFAPSPEGVDLPDLFALVEKETGDSVLFSPYDPAVKGKKIYFTGRCRVPRSRIFDWLQAVVSYEKLVLAPIGPEGTRQWAVLNVNDPAIANRPVYVAEAELPLWKDRDGVYVVSVFTMKHMTDTTRARNALANLITRPVGRINDVPGTRSFVVGDFAPVVCALQEMLRAMDVPGAEPPAAPAPAPAAKAPPKDPIERYEEMLRDARTEEAVRYFVRRIEELREAREDDD